MIKTENSCAKSIFVTGNSKTLSFVAAIVLSIFMMFCDHHSRYLGSIRAGIVLFVAPLQYVVDCPVRVFTEIQSLMFSQKKLLNENLQLRYQQSMLEAQLQKLLVLTEENSQLRELLLSFSKEKMRVMAAQILAVDTSVTRQLVVLNKGKRDGVYVGQPVLDSKGVMGQVIDVGYMTSTVMLISDSKSAVPIKNNRTGERAILVGTNNIEKLSLINLPRTTEIKRGDLLVTSGLGRLYPEGYPVAKVQAIKNVAGEAFITVDARPIALLNRNRLVVLLWPDKEQLAFTEQINQRLKIIEMSG